MKPVGFTDPTGLTASDIDAKSTKGKMSPQGAAMLAILEDKHVENGMHVLYDNNGDKPGGNITYGYGENLGKGPITPAMQTNFPPMTESEAKARFQKNLKPYEKQVNNRLAYRDMTASQSEFDALVSIEYNYGPGTGELLDKIKRIEAGTGADESKDAQKSSAIKNYGLNPA